jgi:uncharacterized protein YcsI (UPF0317 family)
MVCTIKGRFLQATRVMELASLSLFWALEFVLFFVGFSSSYSSRLSDRRFFLRHSMGDIVIVRVAGGAFSDFIC